MSYKIQHQISGEIRSVDYPEGKAIADADPNWLWVRPTGRALTDVVRAPVGERDRDGFRIDAAKPTPAPIVAGPKVLASFTGYSELIEALKVRCSSLNMTREILDELAELPSGYSGKLLGGAQVKSLGSLSLPAILNATGTRLQLIEDEAATAALLPQIKGMRNGHHKIEPDKARPRSPRKAEARP